MQSALLDHYVTYLRAERNLAPKSVDAYATDVRDYLEELHKRGVTVEELRALLADWRASRENPKKKKAAAQV